MSNKLFGTSGVRGVYKEKITPKLVINLAKSFATELGESGEILIGRDARFSGKVIENALVGGFLSAGFNVKKLGIVPTPVVGFSVSELEADAGVMITASHNPPEYNGLKFFDDTGMALPPEREKEIENIYYNKEFNHSSWNKIGNTTHKKVLKNYLNQTKQKISLKKEHKIIIDCANGPTSKTTPSLLEKLGCEVTTINSQLDGTFPGHPPEPVEENLQDLSKLINTTDADLGFAHDGDGDRIAAVDEKGRFVDQDKLLALMGSYSVEKSGNGIVTTVDASKIVDEKVSKAGGEVSRTKVGDVDVVQEMKSLGFQFGGEPSGTWIIGDIHMCPDGTLAAGRILEMLENRNEELSQLVDSMSSYPILRGKIDCPNEEKPEKMKKVKEKAPKEFEEFENMLTVDGIRLEFGGGDWILIRPSGTEPYIRITVETSDRERAETLINTAKNLLEKV